MGLHSSGLTCFTEALSLLLSSTQRLLLILLQSHEDEGEQRLLASLLINPTSVLAADRPWEAKEGGISSKCPPFFAS